MKFLRQKSIQLALFGIAVALGVHLWEIVQHDLWQNLHVTADDPSYYRPAFNWWEHDSWKDSTGGASSYVQRPPLMGILHLLGYFILGLKHSWFIFTLALVFHGWGISSLYRIVEHHGNARIAKIGTSVFILLPCFWGFLSYNITEAFIISGCLITTRFAVLNASQQFQKVMICILLLYLFRPVLIVLFVPALVYIAYKNRKELKLSALFKMEFIRLNTVVLLLLAIAAFWEIRKTQYTGEILNPHPIYHSTNNTQFRPPHQSMTELFKIWETRPEVFHDFMGRSFENDSLAIPLTELKAYCSERNVPFSADTLFSILQSYNHTKTNVREEVLFCRSVDSFTSQLKAQHKFQYYIETPILGMKEQFFKSQLNLTLFQETYRGNSFVEGLRYLCLMVILLSYLAIPLIMISKQIAAIKVLAIGALCYGFILFWVQRMNEDRYLLPLMVIGFVFLLFILQWKTKRRTRKEESYS